MGRKPASGLASRNGTKTPGLNNAIAWGSCPGQAIAARRAAQERRCKLTWPSDARQHSERERFRQASDEASNATL